jgi:hypothetical protein
LTALTLVVIINIMSRGNVTVRIPNPHQGDITESLLIRILKQAHINKAEWEKL